MKNILITGGAGFIGSELVRYLIKKNLNVINIDKLTYSGNLDNLANVSSNRKYKFFKINISDKYKVFKILKKYKPIYIFNLAAETHVDRSIDNPENFIKTNIFGTYILLETVRKYWNVLLNKKKSFRFVHISTDEVYGDLKKSKKLFSEKTSYNPSSPYSSSKASSDHLVNAWYKTYGLPTIVTKCSNNYGPFQFPEKLIPLMILNALENRKLPIYGDGSQIRDWLHVNDHVRALWLIAKKGKVGGNYNIGGGNQIKNINVVKKICHYLDEIKKTNNKNNSFSKLITYVRDRPGHDLRYGVNFSKLKKDLNWKPLYNFNKGLKKTVQWYLDNEIWCKKILKRNSIHKKRLGTI